MPVVVPLADGRTSASISPLTQEPAPRAPRLELSFDDFEVLSHLGDGSYSEVLLARLKSAGTEVALKVMDKYLVLREKKVEVRCGLIVVMGTCLGQQARWEAVGWARAWCCG